MGSKFVSIGLMWIILYQAIDVQSINGETPRDYSGGAFSALTGEENDIQFRISSSLSVLDCQNFTIFQLLRRRFCTLPHI
ncbi:unnamed protein product [Citrullus colocynthis]|uniref:Uncharacterized protein n=1 Tax=Citrullus colocynthis TaxID=252529 RepID=A0ABP0ZD16_9ROSI